MLGSRKVLAIIGARGGSKGLPRKNVLPCGGRPLIAWSIEAAKGSRLLDRAIISSDDEEILETARRFGGDVPFRRPAELASDTASMDAVALHAIDALDGGFDICVLLQATSPLRTAQDIDDALNTMDRLNASSVVTVTRAPKPPQWMYTIDDSSERLMPILPAETIPKGTTQRQAFPPTFVLNGAVYATEIARLRTHRRWVMDDTVASIMPSERSVDVDTMLDLTIANALLLASVAQS